MSVLHSEMAPVLTQGEAHNEPQKPINTRGLWSASCAGWGRPRSHWLQQTPSFHGRRCLCTSPPPPGKKFQSELLFFRPSFILLNQTLCLFLLLYLPAVSMVTSLTALYTIYLFLRFPLCLSHSVLIFLILLSSLPPFLLLYPTPSSLQLLSLFTFICLSPFSPLQACHSIMLVFSVLTYREKVLSVSLSILHF